MLSKIDSNSIVICSNNDKILLELDKQGKLCTFKIMNYNEFLKKLTFDYDTRAIYYLMDKYHLSYENALVYISNLYYVDDIKYNNKLDELVSIKKELLENKLLIIDDVFKKIKIQKKVYFYDLNIDYKFISKYLNNYEIINSNIYNYPKKIHVFDNIHEEINFVAKTIVKLVNDGIENAKIKLTNVSSEYEFLLHNIFKSYGLKLEKDIKLYSTVIGKYFLNNLDEDINVTISKLKEKFTNDEEVENINKIINICNKYTWCNNFLNIKDMLVYELKNTKGFYLKYNEEIEILPISNLNDDNYIFMLGFNDDIPKIQKDEKYITDDLAKELNIESSVEINNREKEYLIRLISSLKNLYISFSKTVGSLEYQVSSLNDQLNYPLIKDISLQNNSERYLKILLCEALDNYVKYGQKQSNLDILSSNVDICYQKYDNSYTKIDKDKMSDYLGKKLLLSYSSIDNYYHCGFKFYIENILKLTPFKQTFSTFIGNLTHHMLQLSNDNNFDYDVEFDKFINDNSYELTVKEKFFTDKIKKELKYVLEKLAYQKTLTSYKKEKYEEKIYVPITNDITLMGIIDKIMYMENDNQTFLSVIDYKTGNVNTNLDNIKYGLCMQLPIYAYLIKKSHAFNNPIITGLYFQKVFSQELEAMDTDTYDKKKYDNLKLIGISTDNMDELYYFDHTYKDSNFIKSMKVSSKGFYPYVKVYNDLDDMLQTVDSKIKEAGSGILNAEFKINPKVIKNKNISCQFCTYKDICYVNEKNKEILEG